MPTLFERLQEYQKLPGAIVFSRKKIRKLAFALKKIYDNHTTNPPIDYSESIEDGKTYRVRNYPQNFVRTIDGLIDKFHHTTIKNINDAKNNSVKKITEKPASETTKKTEKRKRIPAQKPVFSLKK